MFKIKVDTKAKYPRPYWPKELVKEGFVGELDMLDGAATVVIIHPVATLEQVKSSLEITLKDVGLRIERQKNAVKDKEPSN